MFIALTLSACVTPRSTAPTAQPSYNSTPRSGYTANREVTEAWKMYEAENYYPIIPRLLHTISKFPQSNAAIEARFLLGLTYYRIDGYLDAIENFREYLELAPEGEYAAEAAEWANVLARAYNERFPTPDQLDEDIEQVRAALQGQPDDFALQRELADLLWRRGDYDEAGAIYAALVQRNPAFAQDADVAQRVDFPPQGQYTVLTPAETQRRADEANPLGIIHVNGFSSGRDLITQVPRFYVVSGQAINRSESILYNVQVNVTLYGFGNIVYDTRTAAIGRLNPGEMRAFSVRFSDFESINQVDHYEAVGSFER